jgi:co-chaperonin GroES (HSP10)
LVKPVVAVEEDETFKRAKALGITISKDVEAREQTKIDKGVVVAIGPTAFKDFNTEVPFGVGDTIVYAKYAGKAVKDGDIEYLLLNDEDCIGGLYD